MKFGLTQKNEKTGSLPAEIWKNEEEKIQEISWLFELEFSEKSSTLIKEDFSVSKIAILRLDVEKMCNLKKIAINFTQKIKQACLFEIHLEEDLSLLFVSLENEEFVAYQTDFIEDEENVFAAFNFSNFLEFTYDDFCQKIREAICIEKAKAEDIIFAGNGKVAQQKINLIENKKVLIEELRSKLRDEKDFGRKMESKIQIQKIEIEIEDIKNLE